MYNMLLSFVTDWASTVQMVNLIQKTNVLSTTKKNRHQIMKKSYSSSDEEDVTVHSAVQEENKVRKNNFVFILYKII